MFDLDHAPVGDDVGDRTTVDHQLGDQGVDDHRDPTSFGLRQETLHSGHVVGVPPLLLVKDAGHSGRSPVVENPLHVVEGLLFAIDEERVVADRRLLFSDRCYPFPHFLVGNLEITHRVVLERFRIRLPHGHRVGHQLPHGGLKVVVSNHATGNARRSGTGVRLFDDHNVRPVPFAARLEFLGQMPGRRQAVDPGADNAVADGLRKVVCGCHAGESFAEPAGRIVTQAGR